MISDLVVCTINGLAIIYSGVSKPWPYETERLYSYQAP